MLRNLANVFKDFPLPIRNVALVKWLGYLERVVSHFAQFMKTDMQQMTLRNTKVVVQIEIIIIDARLT